MILIKEYKQGPADLHRSVHESKVRNHNVPWYEGSYWLYVILKPSAGLIILREQVLGAERFDLAFRTYVERVGL
jgi:hypothetical protein